MTETATMNLSKAPTKSAMVTEAIVKNIQNGVLKPGERLNTVRTLADNFSVSISVIQSALRELEAKQLIERKANSVALVRDTSNIIQNAEKQVMLCLQDSGHIYGEVSGLISNGLISHGFLPLGIDFKNMSAQKPEQKFKKNINAILTSGLKSVILSGFSYWHYPFMEKYPDVRAVFLYVIDYAGPTPERAVLFDQESAIYQTTAHLASLGRKKIMLYTFKTEVNAINVETMHRHQSTQIKSGYQRALREYDIAGYDKILYRNGEVNSQELIKILKSKDAPDAIVCDMDHTAMQIEMIALKNGIKIPDDLAITGCFNTPWSDLSPTPLTTVDYDWDALSKLAIELALEDEPKQKVHYMKPTLIIKESTGV